MHLQLKKGRNKTMAVRPFFKDDPAGKGPRQTRKPQTRTAPTEGSSTQKRKRNLEQHRKDHPKH